MLAFLEEGSVRAKSRWRQHLRCRGSCSKSGSFETGVRWSAEKDYTNEVGKGSIMEDLDALLKSLDFPVRKLESHRRVISRGRRLMPRKPKGSYEALNFVAVGLERRGSEEKGRRLNEHDLMFQWIGRREKSRVITVFS